MGGTQPIPRQTTKLHRLQKNLSQGFKISFPGPYPTMMNGIFYLDQKSRVFENGSSKTWMDEGEFDFSENYAGSSNASSREGHSTYQTLILFAICDNWLNSFGCCLRTPSANIKGCGILSNRWPNGLEKAEKKVLGSRLSNGRLSGSRDSE